MPLGPIPAPGTPPAETERVVGSGSEPAFVNSWGAAAATPLAAFGGLRFYKTRERVYVSGATKGGTPPSVVFTLPTGYRPAYTEVLTHHIGGILAISDDLTTPGEAVGAVATNGEVTVTSAAQANVIFRIDFRVA